MRWLAIVGMAGAYGLGLAQIGGHSCVVGIGNATGNLNIWGHPEQRAPIGETFVREGRALHARAQLRLMHGEIQDFVTNAVLIDLEGHINSYAVWIARDVAEELAQHEMFVMALCLAPDFMSISKAADGRYVEVNAAFEGFTGYRREEVIGRTSVEIGLWHNFDQRKTFM